MARWSHDECLMGSLSWGRSHSFVLFRRKVNRHHISVIGQLLLQLLVHQIVVRKTTSLHLLRHVLCILTRIRIHSDVVLQMVVVRGANNPLGWRRNLRVIHISIVYCALDVYVGSTRVLLFILDLATVMPHSSAPTHLRLIINNHRTCVLTSGQAKNGPWTRIRWIYSASSSHNDLLIITSSNWVVVLRTAHCCRTDLIWTKIGLPSSNSCRNQIMHRHFVTLVLSSLWGRTFNLSGVPIVIKWTFRDLFVCKLVRERRTITSLPTLIQIP